MTFDWLFSTTDSGQAFVFFDIGLELATMSFAFWKGHCLKIPVVTYNSRNLKTKDLVKTTLLEQDPPNHKKVGGVCLHPPCLTSKDGVLVA